MNVDKLTDQVLFMLDPIVKRDDATIEYWIVLAENTAGGIASLAVDGIWRTKQEDHELQQQ